MRLSRLYSSMCKQVGTKTTVGFPIRTSSLLSESLLQSRLFSAVTGNDSLDELCRKHMELPAQEFALGCSFLHQAALGNKPKLEAMLADHPSLINFRDYDRRTALHVSASEGHPEICKVLIEKGAHLNRSDRWGGSPLDDAKRHRHSTVFSLLRGFGAVFGSPSQASNFITAASEGDVEEIRQLLEHGNIDVSEGDYDQRTALHLAAGEGHTSVLELLCDAGANVNAQDRWGNRPLDDAKNACHDSCVKILERYGAKYGLLASASLGEEALHDLMQQYGKVREGVLSLNWQDVKDLLHGVGQEPTDEVVKKLFEVADVDQDGLVNIEEFMSNSDTFLGGRPARIILVVGGPGSGKGVLSDRLVKECGVIHISSGDILRDEVAKGSPLGKKVEGIMKSGGLVSSAIMVTLMQKRMKEHGGKRILLDGFPRSRENAEDLVALCGKPELALHLSCDDTVLIERILKRGKSGEENGQKRADDNIETALQRIRNYHKYHHVALEFLREENIPVVFLDCSATADGVWEQLRAIGRLMRSAVRLSAPTRGQLDGDSTFEIP